MSQLKILQGDALELFHHLPEASVDLIIADPPYNLGKDYGNGGDIRGFEDYLAFSREWLGQAYRVLKDSGTIYVFMGVRFISYLYDILDRELGFCFNSWICWHYTQGLGRTRGFSSRHDDILMFTRTPDFKFNLDAVRVPQKYYRARNNMRGANPGDVWTFSHVHYSNPNRHDHPTQKPEGLIERLVLASSDTGDRVLDPFAGSGTTLRVCQQLERDCTGFELNPDFVALIEERLARPFAGFDSIDPRMERIPSDLGDPETRRAYLRDHARWFLDHHHSARERFSRQIKTRYGDDLD